MKSIGIRPLVQNLFGFLLLSILFVSCGDQTANVENAPLKESELYAKMDLPQPTAAAKPHEMTIHGDTRVDDYYWMKLTDDQKEAARMHIIVNMPTSAVVTFKIQAINPIATRGL